MALDEALSVTGHSYRISIGATIVTAVAALESLLIDLSSESRRRPQGLHPLLQAFLQQYSVTHTQAETITEMARKVKDRRNTFAHSLTGSYWRTDTSVEAMFTSEVMEETLYTVGRLAILIEEIVQT